MKRLKQGSLRLLAVAFMVLLSSSEVEAHGTAYRVLEGEAMTAIEFRYSNGEPMGYAEVLVFSPQDGQVEYQNGRTDKRGNFAFCPDMPGAWRISANDGMGHLCEATVTIGAGSSYENRETPQGETGAGHPVQGSKTLKGIAGLSMILNLAFAVQLLRKRSLMSKRPSSDGSKVESASPDC